MLTPPLVEVQNQVLGQAVRISGTPFSLHYRSDRVPGRRAAYTLKIPLTGKAVPPGLKSVLLEVSVCGRSFAEKFQPAPEQAHTFAWDGKDAQGHFVPSKQVARIRIGYVYPASYPRPEITRWKESAAPPMGACCYNCHTHDSTGFGLFALSTHGCGSPVRSCCHSLSARVLGAAIGGLGKVVRICGQNSPATSVRLGRVRRLPRHTVGRWSWHTKWRARGLWPGAVRLAFGCAASASSPAGRHGPERHDRALRSVGGESNGHWLDCWQDYPRYCIPALGARAEHVARAVRGSLVLL